MNARLLIKATLATTIIGNAGVASATVISEEADLVRAMLSSAHSVRGAQDLPQEVKILNANPLPSVTMPVPAYNVHDIFYHVDEAKDLGGALRKLMVRNMWHGKKN